MRPLSSSGEYGAVGDLDDVDFARQVLVIWSSGESSGCPNWLQNILVNSYPEHTP